MMSHKSVLVSEVLAYLNPQPGKVYVDATFGAGGHTRAILQHEPACTVIAIDWDMASIETYGAQIEQEFGDRVTVNWGNFAQLHKLLKKLGVKTVDGILADFGTSQMQLKERAGFSFAHDTPLDMRMSPAHQQLTAAELIRTASYEDLCMILWELGGEGRARAIVKAIVEERKKKPITTTAQLAALVERAVPEKKGYRIHPATKTFQALRIYINKELDNIQAFLAAALDVTACGGRIACITFHSLEDTIVKQWYKDQERAGQVTIVTPKGVVPSQEEIAINPSSRSARLRVAEVRCNSI